MNTIREKGLIFSFDLLIAFIIVCLMVYFMLFSLNRLVEEQKNYLTEMELKSKAINLMDSLVKNSDTENPAKGAGTQSFLKKRVEENILNYELLKAIDSKAGEFGLKKLSIEGSEGEEILLEEKVAEKENCIALSRFVLIQNGVEEKKAIVKGVFCSE